MNPKETIINKLSHVKGRVFDVCADLYLFISQQAEEERVLLFQSACENYLKIDTDGTMPVKKSPVSKEKREQFREKYDELLEKLMDVCVKEAIESELEPLEFYEIIWSSIINNNVFQSEEEKTIVFCNVINDERIPYYKISKGVEMEDDEFHSLLHENSELINKIRYILAVDFDQKTQEASNLLDVVLSGKDKNNQAVIMSAILNKIRRDKNEEIKHLREIIDEKIDEQ